MKILKSFVPNLNAKTSLGTNIVRSLAAAWRRGHVAVRHGRVTCSETVPPLYRELSSFGFIASCQSPAPPQTRPAARSA